MLPQELAPSGRRRSASGTMAFLGTDAARGVSSEYRRKEAL